MTPPWPDTGPSAASASGPPVSPATWHLLRRQHGRCPLCRGLLLYASHEPHDEREWEQWHTTIRKAIRKEAITAVMDLGTPGEQAAYHLIHALLPPTNRRQQAQHLAIGPA